MTTVPGGRQRPVHLILADWRMIRIFRVAIRGTAANCSFRARNPGRSCPGYLGKPEKTVEATRNLWLHTGDIFRRDGRGKFLLCGTARRT